MSRSQEGDSPFQKGQKWISSREVEKIEPV